VAGIYIHIPFCKQACNYCDFHFATTLRQKDPMIQALIKELELRANELSNEYVETIYFGGGTPSILPIEDLATILSTVHRLFHVVQTPELTLEANPDDISITQLQAWKSLGVNRLSIGIQSFHEEDLLWMNRAHNAKLVLLTSALISFMAYLIHHSKNGMRISKRLLLLMYLTYLLMV